MANYEDGAASSLIDEFVILELLGSLLDLLLVNEAALIACLVVVDRAFDLHPPVIVNRKYRIEYSLDLLGEVDVGLVDVFVVRYPPDELKKLYKLALVVIVMEYNFIFNRHFAHSEAKPGRLVRHLQV